MPSEVVGRVGQQTPYVPEETAVGCVAGRDGERLGCRHDSTTAERHDLSHRASVDRDGQPFTTFDPTKHFADRVPQVAVPGSRADMEPAMSLLGTCSHIWRGGR
jgi:hypothetical protein